MVSVFSAPVHHPAVRTVEPPSVSGCLWAADNLLVRVRRAAKLTLPQALLRQADKAGVACVVNLLSKAEYLEAGLEVPGMFPVHRTRRKPSPIMTYSFWPEAGKLPTARQVRQAVQVVEDAHVMGLRVLVNGVGDPARAAIVAGCWLAREGYESDGGGTQRLGWLKPGRGTDNVPVPSLKLDAEEWAFVAEWPTGRKGQPELVDVSWVARDEVFPFATVEHWLRVLPTVRIYPGTRGRVHPVDVPVLDGQRASDGADIDLDVDELRRGIWTGERTLRLTNGWQVVFVSPFR